MVASGPPPPHTHPPSPLCRQRTPSHLPTSAPYSPYPPHLLTVPRTPRRCPPASDASPRRRAGRVDSPAASRPRQPFHRRPSHRPPVVIRGLSSVCFLRFMGIERHTCAADPDRGASIGPVSEAGGPISLFSSAEGKLDSWRALALSHHRASRGQPRRCRPHREDGCARPRTARAVSL